MIRLTQVVRFVALFALVIAASHSSAANADAMKGIRAVVFSGASLREPVRIHDTQTATAVWLRLRAGAALPKDSISIVNGRRCVLISAFIFNERNANVRVEDLPAGRGDYSYWMYLMGAGEAPVVISNDRFWRLNTPIVEELRALGVPISDTTRSASACK